MTMKLAAVIMAAGKSTRMKSALPKAAHLICGMPMTRHVVDACVSAGIDSVVVVVGHEAEKVREALGEDVSYAYQTEQLGTGHACAQAMPQVPDEISEVVVLPGDAPLITPEAISAMVEAHKTQRNAATLLTAVIADPSHYGRVVRDRDGSVLRICEAKDADEATRAINEISTSIYCFDRELLEKNLKLIRTDNAQGEYYLTDVIQLLRSAGKRIGAVAAGNAADVLGINNRVELAETSAIMRRRILERLMLDGVTIIDPATTYVDCDVTIGRDSVVHPCTIIERGSRIGEGCEVGPFARLRGVTLPDSTSCRT